MRNTTFRMVLAAVLLTGTIVISMQPSWFVRLTAITLGLAAALGIVDLRRQV